MRRMGNAKWLLACLAAAAGLALLTVGLSDASKGMMGDMDGGSLVRAILAVVVFVGAIAFVVWVISLGVSRGMKSTNVQQGAPIDYDPPTADRAFPVELIDGPGKFRVMGVDQTSGLDVTDHITADSQANAKVKAELRGIVVTRIDRV
jgi:uncharacterized membrane protein